MDISQLSLNVQRHIETVNAMDISTDDRVAKLAELLFDYYDEDADEAEYFAKLFCDLGLIN